MYYVTQFLCISKLSKKINSSEFKNDMSKVKISLPASIIIYD